MVDPSQTRFGIVFEHTPRMRQGRVVPFGRGADPYRQPSRVALYRLNPDGTLGERIDSPDATGIMASSIKSGAFQIFKSIIGDPSSAVHIPSDPLTGEPYESDQWHQWPSSRFTDSELDQWFQNYAMELEANDYIVPDTVLPVSGFGTEGEEEEVEGEEEEVEGEETDVLGNEELSPMDELAKKILAGELSPQSFLDPQGKIQQSPAGGSLTTAPVAPSAPVQAMKSPAPQRVPMRDGGSIPQAGESMLRGTPVSYTPALMSSPSSNPPDVDLNGDGIPDPIFPNEFEPTPFSELAQEHPWLNWENSNTWGMTDQERYIAAMETPFLSEWGDEVGNPYRTVPEAVDVTAQEFYNLASNMTVEQRELLLVYHPEGTSYDPDTDSDVVLPARYVFRPLAAVYVFRDNPKFVEAIQSTYATVPEKYADLPENAVENNRIINPYDAAWEGNEDTPWSDLQSLNQQGIAAPPWHANHDPRLDMFGRPLAQGGLSWAQFLVANNLDPETGIPYGDPDDFEWTVPLTDEMMAPGYGSSFTEFLEGAPAPTSAAASAGATPPLPPPPQQSAMVNYAANYNQPQGVAQDNFGEGQTVDLGQQEQQPSEDVKYVADALTQAGFDQGSLPPMDYGSGKGSPSQQLMPEQTSAGYDTTGAPASPLSGSLSMPIENIQPPSSRGLFPSRNIGWR